jgi:AcrR family transcriptional regulator
MSDERTMTETQKRILTAAVETFIERGYSGAATSEIARRAGVAEGTIFRYYKTKQELLIGTVSPLLHSLVAPMASQRIREVLSAPYPTFEAFLRALAAERVHFFRSNPSLVRLFIQELPFQPELRARFLETIHEAVLPAASEVIRRFQREGQLVHLPAPTIARMVASVFMGYVLPRVFLDSEVPSDDVKEIDAMVRMLTKGLAPDTPP